MSILEQALTYLSIMSSFLTALFIWSWVTLGSFKEAKLHWKSKKLFGDMKALLWLPIVIMLILNSVEASERDEDKFITYFNWVEIDTGLEYQVGKPYVQCVEAETLLDQVGSNLGVTINIIEFTDTIQINAKYTHHSCAVESDKDVADAIGLMMTWRWDRKQ